MLRNPTARTPQPLAHACQCSGRSPPSWGGGLGLGAPAWQSSKGLGPGGLEAAKKRRKSFLLSPAPPPPHAPSANFTSSSPV